MLTGLLLLVAGLLRLGKSGGGVLLVCGIALASLGGLDTALREHFSGFRSHATLLAALPAVARGRRALLRRRAVDRDPGRGARRLRRRPSCWRAAAFRRRG